MEALAPLNDNEQQVLISKVRQMSVQMIEDRRQALIERLNKEAQEKLQKREFVKSKKLWLYVDYSYPQKNWYFWFFIYFKIILKPF